MCRLTIVASPKGVSFPSASVFSSPPSGTADQAFKNSSVAALSSATAWSTSPNSVVALGISSWPIGIASSPRILRANSRLPVASSKARSFGERAMPPGLFPLASTGIARRSFSNRVTPSVICEVKKALTSKPIGRVCDDPTTLRPYNPTTLRPYNPIPKLLQEVTVLLHPRATRQPVPERGRPRRALDIQRDLAPQRSACPKLGVAGRVGRCFVLDHQTQVLQSRLDPVPQRWFRRRRQPPQRAGNPGQRPRVRDRRAPHHHAVAPCLVQHPARVSRRLHVAVPDQRDADRLSQLPDQPPIRLALESLLGEPRVQGQHLGPRSLEPPSKLRRREDRPVPTRPDLHRDRDLHRPHHRRDDPLRQLRVL